MTGVKKKQRSKSPASVSKSLRFEVFKRDKFTCQYCGRRPPDVMLECDHVIARAEGGSSAIENLTTSCFECNRGKGMKSLGEVAPALGEYERLEALQEMLERKRGLHEQIVVSRRLRKIEDEAIGYVKKIWVDVMGSEEGFEWESIRRLIAKGLSIDDLGRAIDGARNKQLSKYHMEAWDRWKYFCGICWRVLRERGDQTDPPVANG